jgi:YD repeat-containing protein
MSDPLALPIATGLLVFGYVLSATTGGMASTYAYDANGNRTSVVVPPPPETTAPTVPANPAASATGFAYNVVQGVAGTQACAGH